MFRASLDQVGGGVPFAIRGERQNGPDVPAALRLAELESLGHG